MNDKRLVIQLVNGLPEEYNTVASFIQQSMPTFDASRSQLRTEEIRHTQQTSMASYTTLEATGSSPGQRPQRSGYNKRNQHHQRPQTQQLSAEPPLLPTPAQFRQPNNPRATVYRNPAYPTPYMPYWAAPPSPYHTVPHWHPTAPLRGPSPARSRQTQQRPRAASYGHAQAYAIPSTEMLHPSDFAEAYSSMSLQSPDDTFYMDTGATSHITADPGFEFEDDPSSL
ncbi:uncharacterized protein LOC113271913 [Papaver somniferum]|uniref:uncharacterized protein LOC113271913 n=1 Tax=Papaver somniferum TaxID=3469 RepID=UPI000E6FC85F|nr:uncharacterized protein LOC113271913 [Papaver somniferum]